MRRRFPCTGHFGFTLLEVAVSVSILTVLVTGMLTAIFRSQAAFLEDQASSRLALRAQNSLDRLTRLVGQALTTDSEFSPLKPITGINSHCLRFRLLQSVDPITGDPIYEDNARVFVYGPDSGSNPSSGLIIGRGPDLTQIHAAGSGVDGILGTNDDDVNASLAGGLPAVEVLLSNDFAPQTGEMFTLNMTPAPVGRLLTLTLRLNARDRAGNFILNNDLVLSERVALRQ